MQVSVVVCCLSVSGSRMSLNSCGAFSRGEGEQPEVIVRFGTNGIGQKKDKILQSEYWEFDKRLNIRILEGSNLQITPSAMCE